MSRLLPRTSITIDEAVSILLGRSDGPIEFTPINSQDYDEVSGIIYDLRDDLEGDFDVIESAYTEAKHENQPAPVIAERLAALQRINTVIEQANAYLCAIEDELNKGEFSVLRIAKSCSDAPPVYITLHSFNLWAKDFGKGVLVDLLTNAVKSIGTPQSQPSKTPGKRTLMLEQEKVILAEIQSQGYDPKSLPKNPTGKPGVKAAIQEALKESSMFKAATAFDKAWERLRKEKRIQDAPPHK